jgi:hypothetical protein
MEKLIIDIKFKNTKIDDIEYFKNKMESIGIYEGIREYIIEYTTIDSSGFYLIHAENLGQKIKEILGSFIYLEYRSIKVYAIF